MMTRRGFFAAVGAAVVGTAAARKYSAEHDDGGRACDDERVA